MEEGEMQYGKSFCSFNAADMLEISSLFKQL
jgi:hypothetical protein